MNPIIDFLKDNLDVVISAPVTFIVLLCIAYGAAYKFVVWHQAGETKNLKADKLKLELQVRELEQGKALRANELAQITEATTSVQQPDNVSTIHEFYMQRQEIHWAAHNERVVKRFWAAGTSLVGVVERDLIPHFKTQDINDIRVVLPSTEPDTIAHHQLHQFDLRTAVNLVHNQVDAAQKSYERLQYQCLNLVGGDERNHLRKYSGIMYFNITIFDDNAFLSPYDSKGTGDSNLAIRFNLNTNPKGYRNVKNEFLRMWDAESKLGKLHWGGCSMIFIDSLGRVLLYQRDHKPGILYPGLWDLLGGRIDPGESPEEAIAREMSEEIEYSLLHPKLFRIFNMPDRFEFTYWCTEDFEISRMPLNEGQRLRWFSEDEILNLPANQVAFGFKSVIQLFLEARRNADS